VFEPKLSLLEKEREWNLYDLQEAMGNHEGLSNEFKACLFHKSDEIEAFDKIIRNVWIYILNSTGNFKGS
jgi:hypothetical protein